MSKQVNKKMSIKSLQASFEVNTRLDNNYDLPSMMDQIREAGRITRPLVIRGEDGMILQGNRRYRAAMALLADPKCPSDLKEALQNLECIVYTELTPTEEQQLIIDHGTEKPISRAEVLISVWRLDRSFFTEAQISNLLFFALAKYTGKERKLNELPAAGPERAKAIKDWFHGTVGNYMLSAAKMGDYVKQQMLLTHKAEDKLLKAEYVDIKGARIPAEVVEMRCDRTRITALSAAKSKDVKEEGWNAETGGKHFNALIETYKAEDRGDATKEKVNRPSPKDLTEAADKFKCPAIRNTFLVASGDQEAGRSLAEWDDRLTRTQLAFDTLNKSVNDIKDEHVKALVKALLSSGPAGEVDVALIPLLKKQPVKKVEPEDKTTGS